ncbi:uncharacterized protein [Elaeis guineensis]|uniref:Uncharacterized protein At4g26450-like isoform X2 n=1 Tax=Elaeis guineensis var. tenera TaxID=51953 RepID=A0A6I9QS66_ELAGV|nr:uncharacterized protein At4g26450-like isoform X2 [Elaeis guineensis]
MQPRHRNPGDGVGPAPVGLGLAPGRNRGRGGLSHSNSKPYNPPGKFDILMEAGRLAAEYLVSKGVLHPNLLPGNCPNENLKEFKGQRRENPVYEYDRMGYRKIARKRMGYHNRSYGSDWGRGRGRKGPWKERSRVYSDNVEDAEDFAPGYLRDWCSAIDEVGSSVSRVAEDEPPLEGEVVGELGSELDNTGSKVCSSSTRKDVLLEGNMDMNKGMDDVKVSNSERSGESGELEKKTLLEDDVVVNPCAAEDGPVSKDGSGLLKFCNFAKVPTRLRSSLAHRKAVADQGPSTGGSDRVEVASGGGSQVVVEETPIESSSDSRTKQIDSPKCEESGVPVVQSLEEPVDPVPLMQHLEESVDLQHETLQSPSGFETFTMMIDVKNEDRLSQQSNEKEESEKQVNSSPSRVSQNEFSQLHDVRATKPSPFTEMPPQHEEMIGAADQAKLDVPTLVTKVEAESVVKMEEEKNNEPTYFKICDINLMESPEITEIPDDPVLDQSHTAAPALQTEKQLPVNFGLSKGINANDADDYKWLSGVDKVIPLIDLKADSLVEANACDSSKPNNEMIYPSLENFLSHQTHTDVLPAIQDGYGLGIPAYLGADISQADLSNLQAGIVLNGAEGFPGVDDSIYGSLGDIVLCSWKGS